MLPVQNTVVVSPGRLNLDRVSPPQIVSPLPAFAASLTEVK